MDKVRIELTPLVDDKVYWSLYDKDTYVPEVESESTFSHQDGRPRQILTDTKRAQSDCAEQVTLGTENG